MKVTLIRSVVSLAMLSAAGQIHATNLIVGGSVNNPASIAKPAGSPIVSDPNTGSAGSLTEGAAWKTAKNRANNVYVNDVYQGTGGYLDFFYQIQNNTVLAKGASATIVSQSTDVPTFTITSFQGFGNLQVFQLTDASAGNFFGVSGGEFLGKTSDTVKSVALAANGTITVNFTGAGIAPGQNSAVLLVEAKATDFDQAGTSSFNWKTAPPLGSTGVANMDPFSLDNLEPVTTPEPGFYGLLSLGVAGIFFVARRRSNKALAAV